MASYTAQVVAGPFGLLMAVALRECFASKLPNRKQIDATHLDAPAMVSIHNTRHLDETDVGSERGLCDGHGRACGL